MVNNKTAFKIKAKRNKSITDSTIESLCQALEHHKSMQSLSLNIKG